MKQLSEEDFDSVYKDWDTVFQVNIVYSFSFICFSIFEFIDMVAVIMIF